MYLSKTICVNNLGVDCDHHFCGDCGHNPAVAKARKVKREIGARLSALAAQRGLSQEALASVLGADSSTVSRWICGRQTPSVEAVVKICVSLDVSPDWLLGFDED